MSTSRRILHLLATITLVSSTATAHAEWLGLAGLTWSYCACATQCPGPGGTNDSERMANVLSNCSLSCGSANSAIPQCHATASVAADPPLFVSGRGQAVNGGGYIAPRAVDNPDLSVTIVKESGVGLHVNITRGPNAPGSPGNTQVAVYRVDGEPSDFLPTVNATTLSGLSSAVFTKLDGRSGAEIPVGDSSFLIPLESLPTGSDCFVDEPTNCPLALAIGAHVPATPTLSQWGLLLVTLTLLIGATLALGFRAPLSRPPLDRGLFLRTLLGTGATTIAGLVWVRASEGSVPEHDVVGSMLTAVAFAYLLHLWLWARRAEKTGQAIAAGPSRAPNLPA